MSPVPRSRKRKRGIVNDTTTAPILGLPFDCLALIVDALDPLDVFWFAMACHTFLAAVEAVRWPLRTPYESLAMGIERLKWGMLHVPSRCHDPTDWRVDVFDRYRLMGNPWMQNVGFWAARAGKASVLDWWAYTTNSKSFSLARMGAALGGHEGLLRDLCRDQDGLQVWASDLLEPTAFGGHVQLLEFIHDATRAWSNHFPGTTFNHNNIVDVIRGAASGAQLHVLEWLRGIIERGGSPFMEGEYGFQKQIVFDVLRSRRPECVEVLAWAWESYAPSRPDVIIVLKEAVFYNNLSALRWLDGIGEFVADQDELRTLLSTAFDRGWIDVCRWLVEEKGARLALMSVYGTNRIHRPTIEYIADKMPELVSPDYFSIMANVAAGDANFGVLDWAVRRGGVLRPRMFRVALHAARATVVKHLRAIGCPWDEDVITIRVLDSGMPWEHGQGEILTWMLAEGCPIKVNVLRFAMDNIPNFVPPVTTQIV